MPTATDAAQNRGPDLQFQHYLSEGEFRLQQCNSCNQFIFYPRVLCPHCGGTELTWNRVSGDGVVYSSTLAQAMEDMHPTIISEGLQDYTLTGSSIATHTFSDIRTTHI